MEKLRATVKGCVLCGPEQTTTDRHVHMDKDGNPLTEHIEGVAPMPDSKYSRHTNNRVGETCADCGGAMIHRKDCKVQS